VTNRTWQRRDPVLQKLGASAEANDDSGTETPRVSAEAGLALVQIVDLDQANPNPVGDSDIEPCSSPTSELGFGSRPREG